MKEEITKPVIKKIKEEGNLAIFEFSPLFPGYGITIGNSIRRMLYSSLGGSAIYSIKIEGVTHEFSSLPGVKEDFIQIILNLKQIRLKIHEGEEAVLKLDVKGPKEIKASDIKCPSSVEIINPDQDIATLTKNGKLSMELKVNNGLGYVSRESKEEEKSALGTIDIDAIYSPIKRVNYNIEPIRVGKMTNYDKLTLEIHTDGTMSPEDALKKSAQILIDQIDLIKNFKSDTKKSKVQKTEKKESEDLKQIKIEESDFSNRTKNALVNNKIKTVGGLIRLSDDKISKLKGLGPKGIKEIQEKVKAWKE